MNWEALLSEERLGGPISLPYGEKIQEQVQITAFEMDYRRILDCSAFRRLQDKTQVFPLEKNDFIRTRLTHSLEVSALARQLVMMIFAKLQGRTRKAGPEFTQGHARHAADIAACAGLLHDIGNPPFGHFGEEVVCSWFQKHLDSARAGERIDRDADAQLTDEKLIADLQHFEGNAQAFRLLTKLHAAEGEKGLNLTAAVLNTLVKYPTDSLHIDRDSKEIILHKLGYYEADREDFEQVTKWTGTFFDGAHHRHPLTFVVEAADDIAYSTADLEDSYKKGLFNLDEFVAYFKDALENRAGDKNLKNLRGVQVDYSASLINSLASALNEDGRSEDQAFRKWLSDTRYWFLYCAAYRFCENYEEIMRGEYRQELLWDTFHEGSMTILKNAARRFTFNTANIVKLELSSEKIIGTLMDRLAPAAVSWMAAGNAPTGKANSLLMTLVSENHKKAYLDYRRPGDTPEDREYNLYLRLLLVSDFVSGMTDTYAKSLYQELSGF